MADPKADAAVVASEVAAASASTALTGGHHRQAPSSLGGSRLPNVTEEQRSATANGHVSAGAGAVVGDGSRIVTSSAKRTGAPTEESDSGSDDGNDSDGSTSSSSSSPPPPPTGNADSTDTVRSHRRGASTLTGKNPRATTSLDVEPTVTTTLSMVISTWNLARLPLPPDLATWLPFAGGGHALVVIGVQECPESQEEMITRIQRHLGETYYLIAHKALWEIRIYVFAHSMQLPPHSFTNVEVGQCGQLLYACTCCVVYGVHDAVSRLCVRCAVCANRPPVSPPASWVSWAIREASLCPYALCTPLSALLIAI